ncbi:GNAT family N-acetyltransferase [Nocardia sp.]|uniref:GNAT family N-acetyltransferase n=1 Tax=Nocardia sp. TaxID=1821 RepID=UPI00260ADFE3|nr:GNAT family N-acetyltransferase [Nocardia sp.]
MDTNPLTSATHKLRFQHLDAMRAQEHRDEVESIFRSSYPDAINSGAAFESPSAFMQRFDAYTAPNRPTGFELVLVHLDEQPCGQAWGWPLQAHTAWWGGLMLDSEDIDEFIVEDGTRTFALSEIMVHAELAGHGIAQALHNELLDCRPESRATLFVHPGNHRAYDTYLRWGWYRVGALRQSWPKAPRFDVLIHDLRS